VTLYSVVVGYRRFGGSCCLHLQVVTLYNVVVGYQRFRGPCRLHLQVVDIMYLCGRITTFRRNILPTPLGCYAV
jgi:hypothetical protein